MFTQSYNMKQFCNNKSQNLKKTFFFYNISFAYMYILLFDIIIFI